MADVEGGGQSKSAKRRAAKKAKEAEAAVPEAPPPAAESKVKAKAKAKPEAKAKAEPKVEPKVEPKAKAQPKAQPKAEPKVEPKVEPKAESKAKGKAKAQPTPEPQAKAAPEPKAAAAKPKAKTSAKAKSKAPAKPVVEEEEEPKKKEDELINYVMDDGSGGAWEVCSGLTNKQQKRKERMEEKKREEKMVAAQMGSGQAPKNFVPGMSPIDPKAAQAQKLAANQAASAEVARILAQKNAEAEKPTANLATAVVKCTDEKRFGIVIGKGGATIKAIQEKTKVNRIDTAGGLFTITGPAAGVAEAEACIQELITKGYCHLLYEEFSENFVQVHPQYFPDLIGKEGSVIKEIKSKLSVEITIPPVPGNDVTSKSSKKYKVTLAGNAQNVEKAKEVINDITQYYHHEVTHPGVTHAELEVDKWSFSYIIGKGGSELKHIQKNWDVKVYIPREFSVNTNVCIVGEPNSVERAKTYVEKLLWTRENQVRGGRDKVDDGDVWGEEEDVEPWMKEYIYKRH